MAEVPTESAWKQRLLFFIGGATVVISCWGIRFYWMDLVPYSSFPQQPEELRAARTLVEWFPWIALFIVFSVRLVTSPFVRIGSYAAGTLTPYIALITYLVLLPPLSNYAHQRAFDADLWRDPETIEHDIMWPPRLCMVNDLVSSGKLDGMKREKVIEFLGPPHDPDFPAGPQKGGIHYYLGPERSFFRIDSEWLCISFGKDGRVENYWIYQD